VNGVVCVWEVEYKEGVEDEEGERVERQVQAGQQFLFRSLIHTYVHTYVSMCGGNAFNKISLAKEFTAIASFSILFTCTASLSLPSPNHPFPTPLVCACAATAKM